MRLPPIFCRGSWTALVLAVHAVIKARCKIAGFAVYAAAVQFPAL